MCSVRSEASRGNTAPPSCPMGPAALWDGSAPLDEGVGMSGSQTSSPTRFTRGLETQVQALARPLVPQFPHLYNGRVGLSAPESSFPLTSRIVSAGALGDLVHVE